jgi:hypothetical protein
MRTYKEKDDVFSFRERPWTGMAGGDSERLFRLLKNSDHTKITGAISMSTQCGRVRFVVLWKDYRYLLRVTRDRL